MVVVFMDVNMGSNVKKVYLNDFDIFVKYFFYIYKIEYCINFKFL